MIIAGRVLCPVPGNIWYYLAGGCCRFFPEMEIWLGHLSGYAL